jgi:hypothetical protein
VADHSILVRGKSGKAGFPSTLISSDPCDPCLQNQWVRGRDRRDRRQGAIPAPIPALKSLIYKAGIAGIAKIEVEGDPCPRPTGSGTRAGQVPPTRKNTAGIVRRVIPRSQTPTPDNHVPERSGVIHE